MQGPFYRITVDPNTGGLASVIHVASGKELLAPGSSRMIGQPVYYDGQEHPMRDVTVKQVAGGPVLARLEIGGNTAEVRHKTFVTVYAEIDRIDFDYRIKKPVPKREQRLCHVFPVVGPEAEMRTETTGAIIRPFAQPKGDMLPGADTKRLAILGFVNAVAEGAVGVTVVPVEAFALRLDLDPFTFEAIGNDQNYQESTRDQNLETEFRFRYSLQARAGGWHGAIEAAFSRSVTSPVIAALGRVPDKVVGLPVPRVSPDRATVLAFKPADDVKAGGHILRVWEQTGESGPLVIAVPGYRRAVQTDLLERNQSDLPISDGRVSLPLHARGFASVRLLTH